MNAVVHNLVPAQKREILRHLSELSSEDRRLRFGRGMNHRTLKSYVKGIDFSVDEAFGIFSIRR